MTAALVCLLGIAACASSSTSSGGPADPGQVVADLNIPFHPGRQPTVITVTVARGERLSIKVDTSDGPYAWLQVTPPDPHVIKPVGNFNDGSCPTGMVGCRVPYFHTMIAKNKGTTATTWRYHDYSCRKAPGGTASPTATPSPVTTPPRPASPSGPYLCTADLTIQFNVG